MNPHFWEAGALLVALASSTAFGVLTYLGRPYPLGLQLAFVASLGFLLGHAVAAGHRRPRPPR